MLYDAQQARMNALANNKRVKEMLDHISSCIVECVAEGMFKTHTIIISVVLNEEEWTFIRKNFEARGYNVHYRKESNNKVYLDIDWT